MRVVIQRVTRASVTIAGELKSSIGRGMMILVGFCNEDTDQDLDWAVKKIAQLRIFDDEQGEEQYKTMFKGSFLSLKEINNLPGLLNKRFKEIVRKW